jgi:hypothetical protein
MDNPSSALDSLKAEFKKLKADYMVRIGVAIVRRLRARAGRGGQADLSERRQTLRPRRTRCARWSGASLRSRARLSPVRAPTHSAQHRPPLHIWAQLRIRSRPRRRTSLRRSLHASRCASRRAGTALAPQSLCRPPRTCPSSPVGWSRMPLRGATVRCSNESSSFTDGRALTHRQGAARGPCAFGRGAVRARARQPDRRHAGHGQRGNCTCLPVRADHQRGSS